MATIYDIASAAGVSTATVSRALRHSSLVTPTVASRIRETARKLGYRSRPIRRQKDRGILTIRVILPPWDRESRTLFYDPSEVLHGLREGLAPCPVNFLVENNHGQWNPWPNKKGGTPDAFVFAFTRPSPAVRRELLEAPQPAILLNRIDPGLPHVICDHEAAMHLLVDHLLSSQTEVRPVFLKPFEKNEVVEDRLRCLHQAFAHASVPFTPGSVIRLRRWSEPQHELRDTLSRREANTLVGANDVCATAALAEALSLGLSVPDDWRITGFDNSPLRALTRPLLTTLELPVVEIGRHAGHWLRDNVVERRAPSPVGILPVTLLTGQTTLPPRP